MLLFLLVTLYAFERQISMLFTDNKESVSVATYFSPVPHYVLFTSSVPILGFFLLLYAFVLSV